MVSIQEIEKIYNSFDDDKNGVLTLDEARKAFEALGSAAKSPATFDADFARLAKDGVIGLDEFKQLANIA